MSVELYAPGARYSANASLSSCFVYFTVCFLMYIAFRPVTLRCVTDIHGNCIYGVRHKGGGVPKLNDCFIRGSRLIHST